jgi:hypothetical protein
MARAPSSDDFAGGEALLRELPEVELLGVLRNSSNYTFLARLRPCGEDGLLAVYKPSRGESPLWDFPTGTLYRREVAAYRLSRALGWPRIPPTVVRDAAPHGVGAMQLFIEADRRRHYLESGGEPADEFRRVALFDVLTNNADRKSGHCLFDECDRTWFIDHGLTFHAEPKLRTVIWDFSGEPLPRELRADLERTAGELSAGLGDELRALLSRQEVGVLRRRLDAILRPGWTFPSPTSGWSVPWPPV